MSSYKSKIGLSLVIPLVIILGSSTIFFLYQKIVTAFVLLLLIDLFVIHLFVTTDYQTNQSTLRIRSGFLYDKTIPIDSITHISETSVLLSSPATSFDRLQIVFNDGETVIISPKNKTGFIQEITDLNRTITITLNKD